MFVREYNGTPVPPPTVKKYDPIKNCKYLLPCGYCEHKKETCINAIPGVKEAVELLIEKLKSSFRYESMQEYREKEYVDGYDSCIDDLMEMLKELNIEKYKM